MLYGTMTCLYSNGKVLMIKKGERPNDPNSGFYTLPGGKLKDIEKGLNRHRGRLESAVREVKEETGLDVIDLSPRGVILFDNSERVFDDWPNPEDFFVYLFEATKYTGTIKPTEEGDPLWVPEIAIHELPKNPGDNIMYRWLENPSYFTGVIKVIGKDQVSEKDTFVDYLYLFR
jgi:8-oxo-dGTP diphosphatase